MSNLQQSDFVSCLNTVFEVYPQGWKSVLRMELLEISEISSRQGGSFSLLFRGLNQSALEFGAHVVKHSVLGEFSLLIGPILPGMFSSVCYQAIFLPLKRDEQPSGHFTRPYEPVARCCHA
ncbi:MAG: hypothetical protein KGZ83_08010 [Sulfuricella sp.]|nr:hypothetical protein [Sulfuricella sp.]